MKSGSRSGTRITDPHRLQGRLTDHRIPLTLSALEEAVQGGEVLDLINRELEEREDRERLDEVVDALMDDEV